MTFLTNFLKFIKNFFFTPKCVFCDFTLEINCFEPVCSKCLAKTNPCRAQLRCEKCGKSIASHGKRALCYFCLSKTPKFFNKIHSVFEYSGIVQDSILRYKSVNIESYSRTYAKLLYSEFLREYKDIPFDFICGAPSHTNKKLTQGFDNVEIICKRLSKLTKIPFLKGGIKKIRKTAKQTSLGYKERLANLRNSMVAKDPWAVKGKTILLIDDVCTTRATVIECSRALKFAGAKAVYALTLATTANVRN